MKSEAYFVDLVTRGKGYARGEDHPTYKLMLRVLERFGSLTQRDLAEEVGVTYRQMHRWLTLARENKKVYRSGWVRRPGYPHALYSIGNKPDRPWPQRGGKGSFPGVKTRRASKAVQLAEVLK